MEPSEVLNKHGSSSVSPNMEVVVAIAVDHSVPETPRSANVLVQIKSSPEVESNVITLDDILDAADPAVDEFEKLAHSCMSHPKPKVPATFACREPNTRKRRLPMFSDESSETEYSSDLESGLSISSPTFLETTDCATTAYVGIHNVVLIHLSSDSDCSIDID